MFDSAKREQYCEELDSAAKALSVTLNEQQVSQLISYLELLAKWNKAYNLTAVRDPDEMLYRHLVDSLSIIPFIEGKRIIDVGTGPGLPGIPMAIVFPEKDFVLLDSNSKKTRFLTQCLIELKLNNVEVFHGRVEAAKFNEPFDQVTSRAFTALDNMVDICKHLLSKNGKFLAMKGLEPESEKQSMDSDYSVEQSIELTVPGCEGQRHLIIIGKSKA